MCDSLFEPLLSFSCARCHDHKFDPVASGDYQGVMAVFNASDEREIPAEEEWAVIGLPPQQ